MARGYGIANYGDGYWGQTKFVDAAATASASASVSGAGQRIKLGLAQKDCTSTVTANANFTTNASAAVASQVSFVTGGIRVQFSTSIVVPSATVVTAAERVRLAESQTIAGDVYLDPVATVVTAGGSADVSMTSGTTASGVITAKGEGAPAASVTTSSAADRIKDGDPNSIDATATVDSAANIDAAGVASIAGSVSPTVDAAITAKGVASLDAVASLADASLERMIDADGSTNVVSIVTASGREMWEPISVEADTWVELTETATQWQEIA